MATYSFTIAMPGRASLSISRTLEDDAAAIALARRFAVEWRGSPTVDVTTGGIFLHREFGGPEEERQR